MVSSSRSSQPSSFSESELDQLRQGVVDLQKQLVELQEDFERYKRDQTTYFESFCLGMFEIFDMMEILNKENSWIYYDKIHRKITIALKRFHIVEISEKTVVPGKVKVLKKEMIDGMAEGTILEVSKKGYVLKDKVLRPAEVVSV